MINGRLYSLENLNRAQYAQIGAGVLAAIVGGYLLFSTGSVVKGVWNAKSALAHGKSEYRQLSRKAAGMKRQIEKTPKLDSGGVEGFAVAFAGWTRARGISIESLSPEGAPVAKEVALGESKLGTWKASCVRVKGQGEFSQITGLLGELRRPNMPVQLESFALQSAGKTGETVSFDLAITVYEKSSSEASTP